MKMFEDSGKDPSYTKYNWHFRGMSGALKIVDDELIECTKAFGYGSIYVTSGYSSPYSSHEKR